MAGPWERYQNQQAPAQEGPWTRYADQESQPLEIDVVGGTAVPTDEFRKDGGASWLDSQKRGLGLGARSVVQGIGGLIGAAGGDAFNAYVMPGEQPSYRDAAATLADRMGLPKTQSAGERVGGDVGEAISGTALTMGAGALAGLASRGAPYANRLAQLFTAQPGLQGTSAAAGAGAAGAVRESGGGEGSQLLAGLAGGLAPGVTSASTAAGLRGLVRGRDGAEMQQRIDDFASLGATPSIGQASGNHGIQGLESLLAGAPTSSGVMTRFAERQADDIGGGLGRMAENLSRNASGERAGRAIERGVQTFSGNVGAQRRALYWQADQHIPQGAMSPMQNTVAELARLTTPDPGAAATTGRMVNPRLQQMLADLQQDMQANGGSIPYESLRRLRTSVGEQMNDFSMTPDTPARELQALYGALSRDMEGVARSIGPEAERAARRANNYTRLSANRLRRVDRVVDKAGGPEAVFNAAMRGTRDGGTVLRSVMQSLPQDGQRAVTAAVIRRMGMPTPGQAGADAAEQFSAATFLTNWNRVSPEARRALFDRHGPGFSRDMDRIARVAETIKEGSKVFQNPAGTANKAAAYTYGAALVGSLFTGGTMPLVGAGIAANGLARYMTNPRAVHWMARVTEMPRGSVPGALNAMRAEAERSGDQDLAELAAALEQGVNESGTAGQQQ